MKKNEFLLQINGFNEFDHICVQIRLADYVDHAWKYIAVVKWGFFLTSYSLLGSNLKDENSINTFLSDCNETEKTYYSQNSVFILNSEVFYVTIL